MQLKKINALVDLELHAGDLMTAVTAAHVAHLLRFEGAAMDSTYAAAMVMLVLMTLVISMGLRVYEQPLGERPISQYLRIAASWAASFVGLMVMGYLLKLGDTFSRGWVLLTFALGLVGFALVRLIALVALRRLRERGEGIARCLLVGATDSGLHMLEQVRGNAALGMDITAYVKTSYDHGVPEGVPLAGSLLDLEDILQRGEWDEVLIALPVSANRAITYAMDRMEQFVVTVKLVPDLLGRQLINHQMEDCGGVPIVTLRSSPLEGQAWLVKNIEDRLLAAGILLMISPLMVALAIGVKLSSPGPVLYRQRRIGLDGKEFEMMKFRSMPVDMEKSGKVAWGGAQNKTTTRFGKFIRQTSLDELPQFLNVLRGDMSIVGPRPERPMFVEQFKGEIDGYMHKHLVKAGITGWAQVNGWRGDTDLTRRIEHDLYYINHWSLGFDLRIIFMTLFKGFVHSEKQSSSRTGLVAGAAPEAVTVPQTPAVVVEEAQ
jgi:putative colanic acid biosynthesis UDP-glucose lipid carrier transferase